MRFNRNPIGDWNVRFNKKSSLRCQVCKDSQVCPKYFVPPPKRLSSSRLLRSRRTALNCPSTNPTTFHPDSSRLTSHTFTHPYTHTHNHARTRQARQRPTGRRHSPRNIHAPRSSFLSSSSSSLPTERPSLANRSYNESMTVRGH